jgi:predicted alpha/beta hydrolase
LKTFHSEPVCVAAYLKNGGYNVFVVDWGELAAIPCYPAAVHNLRPVSRCVAQFLAFLRDSGVPVARTTCVGHSLGAHVCGIAANYLMFRMHRIIGKGGSVWMLYKTYMTFLNRFRPLQHDNP